MQSSVVVHSGCVRGVAALLVSLSVLVGLFVGPFTQIARAEGTASTFVVSASLGLDGVLKVREDITFGEKAIPAEVEQRIETKKNILGDRRYVYDLSGFSATAGGQPVTPTTEVEDRFTTVRFPTNGQTVSLEYSVVGAVVATPDGTALEWPMLQGFDAVVTDFAATVAIPVPFAFIECNAGSPNSEVPCRYAAAGTDGAQQPTFRDGPRGPGEFVRVHIGFPPGALASNEQIEEVWTLARAFSAKPLPLALALGLLVLGAAGLIALHRRAGVDAGAGSEVVRAAEFVPVGAGLSEFRVLGDLRPGHVGTVADERVDPIDVTATLLDLAVHGHLRITELPRSGEFARTDWLLSRTDSKTDDLRPFETALLEGIAGPDPVRVSELSSRVYESVGPVQDRLYDEVVANGWFERRPDTIRSRWGQMAIGALIAAVLITTVLAAFTTLGLIGLALIALALGLLFVAQEMPARTKSGAALLAGLGALRSDLMSHPTNQMPSGRELSEISELLPYAVVLGGHQRWLDAMVASDEDEDSDRYDLGWYHGPEGWHLRDLPDSLRNFITTVSGELFSR